MNTERSQRPLYGVKCPHCGSGMFYASSSYEAILDDRTTSTRHTALLCYALCDDCHQTSFHCLEGEPSELPTPVTDWQEDSDR